jgi:small subunit ribosomal protein S6
MRNYEIMFIVDPNVPEDEIEKINSQVESVVTDAGGNIAQVEMMGRRRLAYEINRSREGFYVLLTVVANGEIIKEVERRFRVMDSVLRYLTVRTDDESKKLEKIQARHDRKTARRESNRPASEVEQPAVS